MFETINMGSTEKTRSEIMKAAAKQAAVPKKSVADVISSRKQAEKMTRGKGDKKCPSGQTLRSPYMTKTGRAVPPKCIKKRGDSDNMNANIVVLHKGRLAQYGYFDITNMKQVDRRKALKTAVEQETIKMMNDGKPGNAWLSIFRRLIYMGTLTKNTDPSRSELFRKDAYWIKKTYSELKQM
jgi:hypothetical protein